MGVAGAPEKTKNHAELIMDMALDMRDVVQFVKDPRPGTDSHIKIRLGSHSGQVCLVVKSVLSSSSPGPFHANDIPKRHSEIRLECLKGTQRGLQEVLKGDLNGDLKGDLEGDFNGTEWGL